MNRHAADQAAMRLWNLLKQDRVAWHRHPTKWAAVHVHVVSEDATASGYRPRLSIATNAEELQEFGDRILVLKQDRRNLPATTRREQGHVPITIAGEPVPLDPLGLYAIHAIR